MKALVDHDEVAAGLEELPLVERQEATDVDERVLLGAHRAAVGESADLQDDLGDGLVGVAGLPLLDEVGVLGDARGVVDDADAVLVAEFADLVQVRQADGLATGHVDGGRDADVGDAVGADSSMSFSSFVEVDVALEGVLARRVVRLVDDHVDEAAAGQFLVQAGGREVHVAGDEVACLMSVWERRCSAPRPWCVGTRCL